MAKSSKSPATTSSARTRSHKAAPSAPTPPAMIDPTRCNRWTAYEWRFNLAKDERLANAEELAISTCQGNDIRRPVYSLTRRARDFPLCRRHQVEVGSMKRVVAPRARAH